MAAPRRKTAVGLEEVTVPIGSLVANPRNPRSHPEMQIERLVASLRHFGQTRPVLVRRANRMIVAGHGVVLACERAGFAEVRVVLWNVDQPTADAFMLGDNRLGQLGEDDADRIRALLRQYGIGDVEAIGFDAAEIDDLMREAADDIEVLEIATSEVADRFWISCRGPLKDQAEVLKRLQKLLATMPQVEVELGTIFAE